jgi:hypothetical protein
MDEQNEIDENELADILQGPNNFQVPHETVEPEQEQGHEIVFDKANAEETPYEELFTDYEDPEYEPEDEEDMPLEADDEDGEGEDNNGKRRSARKSIPTESWQHLQAKEESTKEYIAESAQILGRTMIHYNNIVSGMNDTQASRFLQTYGLKQGIKKFGKKGIAAGNKK